MRVIIAEFTVTFEDGFIYDTVIVVVGEKGMYHCLSNSYYVSAQSLEFTKDALEFIVFSNHKYFKGNSIEKNDVMDDGIMIYRYADNVFAMEYVFDLYPGDYSTSLDKKRNEYIFISGSYSETNTAEIYTFSELSK